MPSARIWTEAEDNLLREIAGKLQADRVALKIGCCRDTVIQRERVLGIVRCMRAPAAPPKVRPTQSKSYATMAYTRDDSPLRAGHPETWGAINRGTILEGEPWPQE